MSLEDLKSDSPLALARYIEEKNVGKRSEGKARVDTWDWAMKFLKLRRLVVLRIINYNSLHKDPSDHLMVNRFKACRAKIGDTAKPF